MILAPLVKIPLRLKRHQCPVRTVLLRQFRHLRSSAIVTGPFTPWRKQLNKFVCWSGVILLSCSLSLKSSTCLSSSTRASFASSASFLSFSCSVLDSSARATAFAIAVSAFLSSASCSLDALLSMKNPMTARATNSPAIHSFRLFSPSSESQRAMIA